MWKFINGINIWGDGTMLGGQPYIANDFNFAELKHDDNYEPVGCVLVNENGYSDAMGYGGDNYDWLFVPSENGGNTELPIGDYIYVTPNVNDYRNITYGGSALHGVNAGGWYIACNVATYQAPSGGARLLYVPTATV